MIVLAMAIASTASSVAADWVVDASLFQTPEKFKKNISELVQGDTVTLPTGEKIKLGSFVGQGSYGRVFQIEETNPRQVIKFQHGDLRSRDAIWSEISSLAELAKENIPHVPALRFDRDLYIIKPFNPGDTLYQFVTEQWQRLPTHERVSRLKDLSVLINRLESTKRLFNDVHGSNILFDSTERVWMVLDPGAALFRGTGGRGSTINLTGTLDEVPKVRGAYDLLIRNSTRVGEYIEAKTIKDVHKLLDSGGLTRREGLSLIHGLRVKVLSSRRGLKLIEKARSLPVTVEGSVSPESYQHAFSRYYPDLIEVARDAKSKVSLAKMMGTDTRRLLDIERVYKKVSLFSDDLRSAYYAGLASHFTFEELSNLRVGIHHSRIAILEHVNMAMATAAQTAEQFEAVLNHRSLDGDAHRDLVRAVLTPHRERLMALSMTSKQTQIFASILSAGGACEGFDQIRPEGRTGI